MKAIRAIIAAVAHLLRVGRVPIARGASHSQPGHHTGSIAHQNISNWRSHRGEEFFVLRSDPFDTALHRWACHLELQPRPCVGRRRGANRGFQPHRLYRPVWWPRTSRRSSIPRPRSVLLGPGRLRILSGHSRSLLIGVVLALLGATRQRQGS